MKKGISPLIATVLIIGFTISIGVTVILWGTDFVRSLQKTAQEQALTYMTCTSDVKLKLKHACYEGEIGIRVVIENSGKKNIEALNVRVYGDKGVSETRIPRKLESNNIKLFTTSYEGEKSGTVKNIELLPSILYEGKEVGCVNVNVKSTELPGCALSELQNVTCKTASDNVPNTCDKLGKIGLVTAEECCSGSEPDPGWCCP